MDWRDRPPYVEEVAPGVFAYVQPDGSWMINNLGFLVGESGRSLLVDASSTETRTRRFLAEVDARSTAAPMALVNTHHHPDHVYGNYLAPSTTPVIAHTACREEMLAAGLEATRVITEPDYGDLRIRTPDITFDDRLTLHLDEVVVELIHVGPAHTTNDVVVWLPEQRVLFTGDVAFAGGQPFLLEGSVPGFARALERLRALSPEVVVPGHGPVCRGDDVPVLLDDLSAYVAYVDQVAAVAEAEGMTALQAAEKHRDNPYAGWAETERFVGNLHRALTERAQGPGLRLRVPDAWPDMVAFHGGPIGCHA